MTEQSEPYHGEIVHTQEVRGSSPFAPTKIKAPLNRVVLLILRATGTKVRRFPAKQGNSTYFAAGEVDPSRPPLETGDPLDLI